MNKNIVIVEDDKTIRIELQQLLQANGYHSLVADSFALGAEQFAVEILKLNPDMVLLDVNLPGISGLHLCDLIRKTSEVPIIFVTSNNTSMDELNCIMRGGDDYIAKPYQVPVLLARIANIFRRVQQHSSTSDQENYRGLLFYPAAGKITFAGKEAQLTMNELKILCCLFLHKTEFVARADLIDYLWDNQVFIDDNALSVNVTRLREKLSSIGCCEYIETRRGMGYRI